LTGSFSNYPKRYNKEKWNSLAQITVLANFPLALQIYRQMQVHSREGGVNGASPLFILSNRTSANNTVKKTPIISIMQHSSFALKKADFDLRTQVSVLSPQIVILQVLGLNKCQFLVEKQIISNIQRIQWTMRVTFLKIQKSQGYQQEVDQQPGHRQSHL